MARGWESKSVEGQIESFESERFTEVKKRVTPAQVELLRKKSSLQLARSRILQNLETVQSPRYREILTAALADLETKLSELD
jgi:hypothetical protein